MANRLAASASAYLRQHQDNPVDWFPWGEEAFAKAEEEQKPIFLSIGYSACHWCHVMAHESFEDEGLAGILNRHFVPVKVDREERPDVDEAYMTFVQLLSGRGGWPLSVFLTPDRKPIFGGTYWPREDRGGYPGFRSICERISEAWDGSRRELFEASEQNAAALSEALTSTDEAIPVQARFFDASDLAAHGVDALAKVFDREFGGFGTAPKFPPHTGLEFLFRYWGAYGRTDSDRASSAFDMASETLSQIARGGIHDAVGGGFHRYSTDRQWHLPHFEKMLYDNALLLGLYARMNASQICNGIVGWLEREMTSPEGLFYSALDADSEGEEGKFYVWSWDELMELPDAVQFAAEYQCMPEGNFDDEATGRRSGANILHRSGTGRQDFGRQLSLLLERRQTRQRPGLDDKVIVGWNGLTIASLVAAGRSDLAERAARAILHVEAKAGRLPHLIVNGAPSGAAFLDDYAYFCLGLLELGEEFRPHAERLADEMIARFSDPNGPGLFFSSTEHEVLFGSTKPVLDQPVPSANAVAARVLVALGRTEEAWRILEWARGWMERASHGTEAFYTALIELSEVSQAAARGPVKVTAGMTTLSMGWVQLSISPGYHVNANPAQDEWLIPTLVRFVGADGETRYPESEDGFYRGECRIPFEVAAITEEFELVVRYQACTDSECLAPQEVRIAMTPQRETR